MNPKSRVYNSKGSKNLKIINAAETCPTKAIIVDDLDNNQRIFPYQFILNLVHKLSMSYSDNSGVFVNIECTAPAESSLLLGIKCT